MRYDPKYTEGIALFNSGEFFAAHEAWEVIWREARSQDRLFYQGLIQAAVAIYQFLRGNGIGGSRTYSRSCQKLSQLPDFYLGLDVAEFRRQLGDLMDGVAAGGGDLDPARVPKIVLDPPARGLDREEI